MKIAISRNANNTPVEMSCSILHLVYNIRSGYKITCLSSWLVIDSGLDYDRLLTFKHDVDRRSIT